MAGRKPARRKRRTPARKKSTAKQKSTSRSSRAKQNTRQAKTTGLATGLSLDRKLDILGLALAVAGLLSLLSLISANRSAMTGTVLNILQQTVGWGVFILPLVLLVLGIWLILRHFERIPQVSVERIVGFSLLFLCLLAGLHFLAAGDNISQAYAVAQAGDGGGYIGAFLSRSLNSTLGGLGAGIALTALVIIGVAMALDLTVAELFSWVTPLANRAIERLNSIQIAPRRQANKPAPTAPAPSPSAAAAERTPARVAAAPARPGPNSVDADIQVSTSEIAAQEWILPSADEILEPGVEVQFDDVFDRQRGRVIEETLASFGAPASIVEINRGPTITQFGVEPDYLETRSGRTRVRVGKIASLADDLALALSASSIRVQAPVPGKGFVGIEVPNEEVALVSLRDNIESDSFTRLNSPLAFALGENVAGQAVAADLKAMPHLLIAGATGAGKSVCVNALICCLLMHNTPNDLRLLMVDPKRVELTGYNGIPHLLTPVIVELDRVVGALGWVSREMDQRYNHFSKLGARNIQEFNARRTEEGGQTLPYLVVVIDELADLMMLAPDETERSITRLAQLARATGIHLVLSTQRPSVDVVTGLIKANFPARVAFAVTSGVDSRVILDQPGAERLLGSGDMLFQAPDAAAPIRLQGVYLSEPEINRLVNYWRGQAGMAPKAPAAVDNTGSPLPADAPPAGVPLKQMTIWEEEEEDKDKDPLYDEAVELVRRHGKASVSMLQRRMRIGYTRAARLVESMEEEGIVGPPAPGSSARDILDYGPMAPPVDER
ncbi:MAG: DNA translocase FtsK 4TM domain-containing protein [Anaerolineales bacterium]|nr:DNA translocase FtsK 4TM domain-containing protein [Anaerolineales bacterium]